jgi:hypothetical protein
MQDENMQNIIFHMKIETKHESLVTDDIPLSISSTRQRGISSIVEETHLS